MTNKERLEILKHKCNFRRAKECGNCKFFDYADKSDYALVFFCSNPKNEDEESIGGEEFTWEIPREDFVCDYHEFKE